MRTLPELLAHTWIVCLLSVNLSIGSDALKVLPDRMGEVEPGTMLYRYLLGEAEKAFKRRAENYEQLKTPEQLEAHQQRMREFLRDRLGDFPLKTPLNARVVRRDERDGYSIERILYESRPRHYVTALLYLPKTPAPHPAVLIACGHSPNAKSSEAYQRAGILLAKSGMAALCYDPIGQGERYQILQPNGRPRFENGVEHMLVAPGSILLGRSAATYRVWDGIRGLDYLVSRKDIDPERLGLTGNSGGGLVTAFLMAVDERVACAAPSCYITHVKELLETQGPGDSEQQIYGEISQGLGHADYLMIRAPKPTLICAATRDKMFDISGSWRTLREAKRFYGRLGHPERVDLVEADVVHGFFRPLREGIARWMRRWLIGIDDAVVETDFSLLSEEEGTLGEFLKAEGEDYSQFNQVRLPMIHCSPKGQVQLMEGARSVFDFNRMRDEELASERRDYWKRTSREQILQEVRRRGGIRELSQLPPPDVEEVAILRRRGYEIRKLILRPDPGIWLPALRFDPKTSERAGAVLYLHGQGKQVDAHLGGPIEELVLAGHQVLAVDLRGVGETQHPKGKWGYGPLFGHDWEDFYLAYMLGRSYLGMRVEDALVCARYLVGASSDARLDLVGIGEAGPVALHAAALEPDLFASLELRRSLVSWSNVVKTEVTVNQLVNTVYGALEKYDLPDLLAILPKKRVTVIEATDATGELVVQN